MDEIWRVDSLFEKSWLQHLLLSTLGAALLISVYPIVYILLLGGQRYYTLAFQYTLFAVITIALFIFVLRIELFQKIRRQWLPVFLFASSLTIISFLLQTLFLHWLDDLVGFKARLIAQAVSVMLCIAFAYRLYAVKKSERALLLLLVILVVVLVFLQWFILIYKLRWMKPWIALYGPILIFGLPLLAESIIDGWSQLSEKARGLASIFSRGAIIVLMLFLAYFYYQASKEHSNSINKRINSSDQAFYIQFIKDVYRSGFTTTGDHNRMPLYPYLQALFYRDGMSDKELFAQGKQINILLSLGLLGILFMFFLKRLQFYQSAMLIILIAFSLFIFKAPYLQAEILFFFFSSLSFILMLQMLYHPTWLLTIFTGIVAGLAYLSKGTILPSVFLFALIFGGKQLASLIQENIQPGPIKLRAGLNHLGKLLLFLLVFTAVIFPYIHAVKQRFGKYFYNVNTTVYIWYENYDQALEEEAKYHFMEHWPQDLNASQIPGFQKYMREHSLSQIVERFRIGVGKVFQNVIRQHGVFNYWLGMVILFLSAIFIDLRNSLRTARRYPILILFIVLYFCGYFIAFSWYSHIAGGRRFLFSLYIPVLVTVFLGINALAKNQNTTLDRKHYRVSVARFFQASNIILAFILVYDAWLILTKVMFFGRFGS